MGKSRVKCKTLLKELWRIYIVLNDPDSILCSACISILHYEATGSQSRSNVLLISRSKRRIQIFVQSMKY
jgi:hypothetical protein